MIHGPSIYHRFTRASSAAALLLLITCWTCASEPPRPPGPILQLTMDGAIGPASADYFARAMDKASGLNAQLVVIRMDTPGGLDSAMRQIIKRITNSSVPVATYVAPTGARAASAGTYILYASHIAAMAPGTNLGAATPVSIGGLPGSDKARPKQKNKDSDASGQEPAVADNADAMRHKVVNDAVAYIRSLADLHGRNADWAETAVREAASLPAQEALQSNVIDLVASSMDDLLKQLNDRKLQVLGQTRRIQTTGSTLHVIDPDWRSRLLGVITDPNVAYILLLIGIYGLIFEFANPGSIVPGTVGAICLLIALYAFQLLPINYAGVALLLLGVALMVGEAFQPSFGILGIGGSVAFVIGSIILMETDAPGFGIDISVIITFTAISALVFIFVIGMAIRARRRPVVSGLEQLVGGEARVLADFDHRGQVLIHSETWTATSPTPLKKNQKVRVTGLDGLTLNVEPLASASKENAS